MTKRQRRSLVFALATIVVGFALAADAEAQVVTYYYGDPVSYSGSVLHYHRVYQGASWHWTASLGWHTHDHYADVPHRTAVPMPTAHPISAPENQPTPANKGSKELEPQPAPLVPKAPQGKFVVLNHSGVNRYVSINGARFYAAPGRTELWIPRGIVEAYLTYWESPKLLGTSFWRWTGRHYEMALHIRN